MSINFITCFLAVSVVYFYSNMEKLLNTISFKYSDTVISETLNNIGDSSAKYSIHFSQNEDAFLKCNSFFTVPSFAIHHDVNKDIPSDEYLSAMREFSASVIELFPNVFAGTRYFFDPAEILRPCFVQIFRSDESFYLYLMRLDLNIRLSDDEIITPATNDKTAEYKTEKLYLEGEIIPIKQPDITVKGGEIPINRLFSSTWIGETGTGYHINGQWIDREITKLLSSAVLPAGIRTYPYYPMRCDFNTICLCPADFGPEGRKTFLTYLHKTLPKVKPLLSEIETGFKSEKFSKEHPLYAELKKQIPDEWTKIWSTLKISPYLNENEMKEYLLEYTVSQQ